MLVPSALKGLPVKRGLPALPGLRGLRGLRVLPVLWVLPDLQVLRDPLAKPGLWGPKDLPAPFWLSPISMP